MSLRVKICGLSTETAVAAAIAGGADFLGFVFFPPSPRNVAPEQVRALCAAVPEGIHRVGLFVDADDDTIGRVLSQAPLGMLQFHGKESPARVAQARARWGLPIIKALPVAEPADLTEASAYSDAADWLLFDARPPKGAQLPGGNGVAFDWRILSGQSFPLPWMLSGGLSAATLAEAVKLTGAKAVDVSSGVESAPGVKDPERIREFLENSGIL